MELYKIIEILSFVQLKPTASVKFTNFCHSPMDNLIFLTRINSGKELKDVFKTSLRRREDVVCDIKMSSTCLKDIFTTWTYRRSLRCRKKCHKDLIHFLFTAYLQSASKWYINHWFFLYYLQSLKFSFLTKKILYTCCK